MPPQLSDLERLARQAGEILRLGYEQEHQVDYKGAIDLVTRVLVRAGDAVAVEEPADDAQSSMAFVR